MSRSPDRPDADPSAADGFPPGDEVVGDSAVVGLPAVVTVRIGGGAVPGEVRLFVRGTYENLIAYAREPLEPGRHVVVVSSRGGRAADVEFTFPGG